MNRNRNRNNLAAKVVTGYVLTVGTTALHLLAAVLSSRVSLFPGTDALSNIVSTGAEIIAGLYGITAAGYTFFLSRIDALTTQDATLDYIVESLKNRYKYLMWFISGNVLCTLFVSIFLMYYPAPTQENYTFFYRFFCNEFVISMASSLILIIYYSLQVVNPNAISKEAQRLKKRISRSLTPSGNVITFISLYDRMEQLCSERIDPRVLSQVQDNKGRHFEYTISMLIPADPRLGLLVSDIVRVHRYYECTVNCSPMTVNREMCDLAMRLCAALEQLPAPANTDK